VQDSASSRIRALVRERFGSRAEVKRFEPMAGDASTRRYERVWLEGSGVPPTAVVMLLADRGVAISSEELAVFEQAPSELPYVNVHRFLVSIGVAVPELYVDASDTGILLLEDIGDVALWDAVQGKPEREVERLFELAIDQLLLMQIEGTARLDERCIAARQRFDERLFLWEFEHFIEYGLPAGSRRTPAEDDLALFRRHFAAIARFLDRQSRVLNHRDFHSWNLFVHEGRIRVIDFQDALLAPAPYDLATLLGDRVTPSVIRPGIERRLLAYYAAGSVARGGYAWSEEDLWNVYAACALQKAFKVVGRFFYLDRVKGKPGYLRYIPPTLGQIARLLAARPDLEELRARLAAYFPEIGS
jgi:aminoglycoside/choline kinase family phosphotransferase